MRAVVQRVREASVKTGTGTTAIGPGFLVLVAAAKDDSVSDARYLADKVASLRIMADENGKMNRSLTEVDGDILVVSQFTLYARTRKGNRPSFIDAARPEAARELYGSFIAGLKEYRLKVATGSFGDYMLVSLVNDGPVTIIIDSKDQEKPRRG